ncbi:MAG: nuclease-related domain-containing protein [Bacillota bacterium]|jgi:hypothetical protein
MAKTYRKHRHHGLGLGLRQLARKFIGVSRPLAWGLFLLYLLLPWLLPLGPLARALLSGLAVLSAIGAYIWGRRAVQVAREMDILAAGRHGEGKVARLLAGLPRDWVVLNDLALRAGGPIVQIDHVAIAPSGVFVLETKAQKGQIVSAPPEGSWQVKRREGIRTMANPVQQNRAQVQACRYLLDRLAVQVPCRGLVVMTEAMAQTDWPLVKDEDLPAYLSQEAGKAKQVLSPKEVRKLARDLLSYQVRGRAPWQKGPEHWRCFALSVLAPFLLYGLVLAGMFLWNRI